MIYWILLLLFNFTFAQNTIQSMSQDMPDPNIPNSKFVQPPREISKYKTLETVKGTLEKHFPKEMKKMDWSQQDLFYKSLVNYSSERLHAKYPFTKGKNITKIKEELNEL